MLGPPQPPKGLKNDRKSKFYAPSGRFTIFTAVFAVCPNVLTSNGSTYDIQATEAPMLDTLLLAT